MMKKRTKVAIISILAAVAIIGATAAAIYYVHCIKVNTVANEAHIYVRSSCTYDDLLDSLQSSGAIKSFATFKRVAKAMKLEEGFLPGHYTIEEGLNNKAVVRVFANGWQVPVNLTLRGYIRNREKLAKYLGDRLEADSTAISNAINDKQLMTELGFNDATYISMFLPDTYQVYWTITPVELIFRMKKEYDAFWNVERQQKANKLGLTQDEVMTLASIVIEETKYEPEMPTIAGVYLNRLRKGMLLQADPTVKFALNEAGITRILNKHLKIESPYNTYIHKGLPPGPLTIAPKVAIDAVLNRQEHNYLYFCAKETFNGQHNFAATYSQHLENARRYHRALSARQAAK